MGEFADMAIQDALDFDAMYDSFQNGDVDDETALDLGFITPTNIELSHPSTQSHHIPNSYCAHTELVRTIKYLNAFKEFYKKHGYLSHKQKIIIARNHPGGIQDFIDSIEFTHGFEPDKD